LRLGNTGKYSARFGIDAAHSSGTPEAPARKTITMFLTIAAVVACVCVAVLPAVAELRRMIDDRDNPTRLLKIPTRRSQVEGRMRKS
jgi:hypothetical protein